MTDERRRRLVGSGVGLAAFAVVAALAARDLTAILLTQREFESPTPAPLYNAFERAAGL